MALIRRSFLLLLVVCSGCVAQSASPDLTRKIERQVKPRVQVTGSKSRKSRNLAQNANYVVCTERAQEAVIVEGTAEIADVPARRRFLPKYERKYKFDMSRMKQDILSMKEPVFAVRPRLVFGLWEKHFVGKSTRWRFE